MKKTSKTIFFIVLLSGVTSFFTSCVNSGKNDKNEFPVQLNYNKKYPKKDIHLKEIADVEYIAFRDNDALLEGSAHVAGISISDEYIIMSNYTEGTIFIFDRGGKLINKFNKKGKGRAEYQQIAELSVDFKTREIFVFEFYPKDKAWVYSFEGEFKRNLDLPPSLSIEKARDYNDEYLLCHFRETSDEPQETDNIYYYFISKEDGKFIPISRIVPKEVISSSTITSLTKKDGMEYMTTFGVGNANPIFKNTSETLVSDFGCDTIFISKGDREFTPFVIKSPPMVNSEEPTLVFVELKTTKYTFVEKAVRSQNDRQIKNFVIDNITGEIFEPNIIFLEDETPTSIYGLYSTTPDNHAVMMCRTSKYLERYEKGELNGELKEFVSTLGEEDNDFLRIIRFKD